VPRAPSRAVIWCRAHPPGGSGRGVVTGLIVPSRARNIRFPLIDANCGGSGRGVVTGARMRRLIVPSPLSNIVKPYQQHATCTFFAASRKGSAKRHLPLRLHSSHSSGPTPRLLCFLSAALSNCRAPHKRPHAAPVQRYSSASCAVQPFRPQSLHTAAPLVFKCFFQVFVSKQNTTMFPRMRRCPSLCCFPLQLSRPHAPKGQGVVFHTCEQTIIFAPRTSQPSTASAESAKR